MRWPRVAGRSGDKTDSDQFSDDLPAVSDDVLASALDDLEAGMTPLQVIQRYPEQEAELAALLQTAYELRTARWPAMSVGGRVAGREAMHAALAAQKRGKSSFLPPLWRQVGVSLALALIAGAAFLASPYSPLDRLGEGSPATPTVGAPALGAPTATFALPPSPSVTVTPTSTGSPTPRPQRTIEPSETAERLVLADPTRILTSTPKPALTPTRRAALAGTATPAPTATAAASVTPSATGQGAEPAPTSAPATEAPAQPALPTVVLPTSTPSPLPPKPSPTFTDAPTPMPEPTLTPTLVPTPTHTQQPSPTAAPTATPAPTETVRPPYPRLSQTPEPTRTPRRTGVADSPAFIRTNEQAENIGGPLRLAPPKATVLRRLRP